jgi:hypothetical protein
VMFVGSDDDGFEFHKPDGTGLIAFPFLPDM